MNTESKRLINPLDILTIPPPPPESSLLENCLQATHSEMKTNLKESEHSVITDSAVVLPPPPPPPPPPLSSSSEKPPIPLPSPPSSAHQLPVVETNSKISSPKKSLTAINIPRQSEPTNKLKLSPCKTDSVKNSDDESFCRSPFKVKLKHVQSKIKDEAVALAAWEATKEMRSCKIESNGKSTRKSDLSPVGLPQSPNGKAIHRVEQKVSDRDLSKPVYNHRADIVSQIQSGIQLRSSAEGARIRTPTHSVCTSESSDERRTSSSSCSDVLTVEEISYLASFAQHLPEYLSAEWTAQPPSPSQIQAATSKILERVTSSGNSHCHPEGCQATPIDLSTQPGFQEIPPDCPVWKKAVIEKKNKQIEEAALREHLNRQQEVERWRDVPEWKKILIIEKEKKKQDEMAPVQAERIRMEGELQRLQNLPEWKRNLILKKRGEAK